MDEFVKWAIGTAGSKVPLSSNVRRRVSMPQDTLGVRGSSSKWLSNWWDAKDVRDVARGSNTAIFEHLMPGGHREARYLITDCIAPALRAMRIDPVRALRLD